MTYLFNKLQGYVALGTRGAVVWGSFRPSEAEARQFYELHNPMCPVKVVPVEIKITGEATPSKPKHHATGD